MPRVLITVSLCLFASLAFANTRVTTHYASTPIVPKLVKPNPATTVPDGNGIPTPTRPSATTTTPTPTPAATPAPNQHRANSPRWHSLLPGMFR